MQRAVLTPSIFCTVPRDPRWRVLRRKAPRGLRVKGIFRGCFEWLQEGCKRGIFSEAASNGTADTPQVLHVAPRPSLMETGEESSKRVASEAKAPQGHRREPFLRNFLGEQKVPRRRQNAPMGEKARAAGPKRTTPGGRKEPFPKIARAAWPKKTFSVK